MGVARTVYIRRAVTCVLSSSCLHATSCILFGISASSLFPLFPLFALFPPFLSLGDTSPVPPIPFRHICLTLSVPVRHDQLTLSVSLFDMCI